MKLVSLFKNTKINDSINMFISFIHTAIHSFNTADESEFITIENEFVYLLEIREHLRMCFISFY